MNKAAKSQRKPSKGKTPVAEYVLADIEARVKLGKSVTARSYKPIMAEVRFGIFIRNCSMR